MTQVDQPQPPKRRLIAALGAIAHARVGSGVASITITGLVPMPVPGVSPARHASRSRSTAVRMVKSKPQTKKATLQCEKPLETQPSAETANSVIEFSTHYGFRRTSDFTALSLWSEAGAARWLR